MHRSPNSAEPQCTTGSKSRTGFEPIFRLWLHERPPPGAAIRETWRWSISSPVMPCLQSDLTNPAGTTASNMTPKKQPRSGRAFAGVGGDRRTAGGHSPTVPVHRPGGSSWRRLSLRAGLLGLLTAFGLTRPTRAHAGKHHRDVAMLGVRKSSTAWPDLAVAAVMTGISMTSSVQILRQAWTKDRTSAVLVAAHATKGIRQTLPRDRSHTEHGPKTEVIQHHVCLPSAASIPCV